MLYEVITGELGAEAEALHRQVGEHARARGLDAVLTVGPLAAQASSAAGGRHFPDKTSLCAAIAALRAEHPDITLLAKGARSSRMEDVVAYFQNDKEQAC